MRERVENLGGTFTLESAPGQGTLVQAIVLLDSNRHGSLPGGT
jgi:signal transduction histidine kinase